MQPQHRLEELMRVSGHCVFGRLSDRYARQAALTSYATTPQDAFDAWLQWLDGEGGKPTAPLTLDQDRSGFFIAAAQAIRQISQENPQ